TGLAESSASWIPSITTCPKSHSSPIGTAAGLGGRAARETLSASESRADTTAHAAAWAAFDPQREYGRVQTRHLSFRSRAVAACRERSRWPAIDRALSRRASLLRAGDARALGRRS